MTFQSTHPYGVRPLSKGEGCQKGFISIHAPVWGATKLDDILKDAPKISIHAPVWGATSKLRTTAMLFLIFQSTHPYGVRLMSFNCYSNDEFISIHAPVWGATLMIANVHEFGKISIHAPVWGATSKILCRN